MRVCQLFNEVYIAQCHAGVQPSSISVHVLDTCTAVVLGTA